MKKYLLSIDQGTTTSRTVLFNLQGEVVAIAKIPFKQYYPKPGYVEHDPLEIYRTVCESMRLAMSKVNAGAADIQAIGITNQRETVLLWDKFSGEPVYPAIVWQCRRTADLCHELVREGKEDFIRSKTGLLPDAYFSGSKIRWILDHVPEVRARAQRGEILAGTIDTWILWKLSAGSCHATDVSNASRTMLFNIHSLNWDEELLALLDIPAAILPKVCPSAHHFANVSDPDFIDGDTDWQEVPIAGIAGDQQAALFGQACFDAGMVKSTYGTGGFILAQTGSTPVHSEHRLLTTIAWDLGQGPQYALEGSVFNAGATLQWLKDELGLIQSMDEVEELAKAGGNTGDLFIVPAFTGLGAPYWNMEARGMIVGLTRGVNRAQLVRAALDSIAYQVADVYACMDEDCKRSGVWQQEAQAVMRVDGGVAVSDTLLQLQTDLIQAPVERPLLIETTALGAGLLAGLTTGVWADLNELRRVWQRDHLFRPQLSPYLCHEKMDAWHHAVQTTIRHASAAEN